jgi:hypothetical protein
MGAEVCCLYYCLTFIAGNSTSEQTFESFLCTGTDYNPMASLSFTSAEQILKHLYIRSYPNALAGTGHL